jgi:hypothetical protein
VSGRGAPRAARGRRAAPLALLVGGAAVAAACTEVPTGADTPFSIEFRLPFPAVVVGDTLRDSTGAVAPLAAVAYNADGDPIPAAPIGYFVVGGAAVLLDGGLVRGDTAGRTVRVSADANGIPSLPLQLAVVARPDSLAGPDEAPDTLRYGVIPDPALDRSEALTVRVLSVPEGGTAAGVASWVVRYRLVLGEDTLPVGIGDTTLAWLVDDNGRPSALDTTDASGAASRRVRVNGLNPAIDAVDSLVISVTAQGTRAPLRGAPVLLVLPVRPRQ